MCKTTWEAEVVGIRKPPFPTRQGLATQLAHGATQSLGGIKRLCDGAHEHDLRTHLDLEREALLRCARSEDGGEGVRAFTEKRPPKFSDKRID